MNGKDFLTELLGYILKNKKFPAYQAERRIDIFVNYFLNDILKLRFSNEDFTFIAPEFPLKKMDEHGKLIKENLSTKLDYLYTKLESQRTEILFIELKTDSKYYTSEQHDRYLQYDWPTSIEGLKQIICTSKDMPFDERYKYFYLVTALKDNKLILLPNEFEKIKTYKRDNGIWNKKHFTQSFINSMEQCAADEINITVIYIGPESMRSKLDTDEKKENFISFDAISKIEKVTEFNKEWQELVKLFAKIK